MHMAYFPNSSLLVVAVKVSHLLFASQGISIVQLRVCTCFCITGNRTD